MKKKSGRFTCPPIPRGRYVAYQTLLSSRDLCFLYLLLPHVNLLATLAPAWIHPDLPVENRYENSSSLFQIKLICHNFPHSLRIKKRLYDTESGWVGVKSPKLFSENKRSSWLFATCSNFWMLIAQISLGRGLYVPIVPHDILVVGDVKPSSDQIQYCLSCQ